MNETAKQELITYVQTMMHEEGNEMSLQQWLGLLNAYVSQKNIRETAQQLTLSNQNVRYWYYRFSMCLTRCAMHHFQQA